VIVFIHVNDEISELYNCIGGFVVDMYISVVYLYQCCRHVTDMVFVSVWVCTYILWTYIYIDAMIACNRVVIYPFLYMHVRLVLTFPAGTYSAYGLKCSAVLYYNL